MRRFDTIDPGLVTGGPGQGQCDHPGCTLVDGHDCEHAEVSYSGLVFHVLGGRGDQDDISSDEREALQRIFSLCDEIDTLTEDLDHYIRSLRDKADLRRVYNYASSGTSVLSFDWPISSSEKQWVSDLAEWG